MASTGWLKAPHSLGRLPPTMVWDQARAKQLTNELQGDDGRGGGERQVGPPAQTATPNPRLPRETEPHRTRDGIVHAGSTIS